MAFSEPTYFYESTASPDLVDTNGPIYARTPVILGDVVPIDIKLLHATMVSQNKETAEFDYNIISHDLHCVKVTYAPVTNDSESAILSAGLVGYVDVTNASTFTQDQVDVYCTFEPFPTGCNWVSPIKVVGVDKGGYFICGGILQPMNVPPYDNATVSVYRGTMMLSQDLKTGANPNYGAVKKFIFS